MSALFDSVRHITDIDAAERAGIPLVRRGGSMWACCPLHGEKTPPAGPLPEPKGGKRHAERAAEILYYQLWDEAYDLKWKAQVALDRLHADGNADWDNPVFVTALKVHSRAEERLAFFEG